MTLDSGDLSLDEYRALAELHHQIAKFRCAIEKNAASRGIPPERYVLLLAVEGLPEGTASTVPEIAKLMGVSVESASRLLDEAVSRKEVSRVSGAGPIEWVKLTRAGRAALREIALANCRELDLIGPGLLRSVQSVRQQHRRHCRVTAA